MPGNIVADTSCLIVLDKIGRLILLKKVFGKITVTEEIASEFGKPLPDFVVVEKPLSNKYQKFLRRYLDKGEASAFALAIEKEKCLLIIDEVKARRHAKFLNLDYTGTLGLIILAKQNGYISSCTEVIDEIQNTNFRIDTGLIEEMKKICNE